MRKITLILSFAVLYLSSAKAIEPQREFRANWVATLSNIDWPKTKITTSGNQAQIDAQKAELINILDKMQEANMNAVFLQIRPMADALYPTTITTWSSYLTGKRGADPGYDPLAFAIEEAHKRGLELHGWMNPYRYTNSTTNHSESDYMLLQHPEWLLDFGSKGKILDPGIPAVRKHIAQVTKEVIVNYPDIDGIVWDDYFYIASVSNEDANTYRQHNPQNLSLKDWRRDNVNKTVKEVYDTIQRINPGIRFGISPRGIWSTSVAAANKYGVTLPSGITGADNYNSIYCDALAWLSEGTIDYISPQLYWATHPTGSQQQDYNVLAPWWQSIADKYGRHFYGSHALYRGWLPEETGRQITKNRAINSASPGSIFYNTTHFIINNYNTYLHTHFYQKKILPPVIAWKGDAALPISNVNIEGNVLSWSTSQTDGSFVIFAIPDNQIAPLTDDKLFQHMLTRHWTKDNTFDMSKYAASIGNRRVAVAGVDRFARISTPVYASTTSSQEYSSTKAGMCIQTENGRLHIKVDRPQQVIIYSVGGTTVHRTWITAEWEVELPRGVYLIRSASEVKRIII